MARARNIKPGFFKNEVLAEMPVEARLLFIGLWCLADREGRLGDRPKRIRAELFPYDQMDVDSCLRLLEEGGFLIRYEVDSARYMQILNFTKHQMPHHKEVASDIPSPPGFDQITKHTYDVSNEERSGVFQRDGMACLKCGSTESLSLDHIKPLASGGDNSTNNLQTLCKSCNSSKGNTTKDYRKFDVGSTLAQRKNNDTESCRTDSLIPDSLIPDTGFPSLPAGKPPGPVVPTIPVVPPPPKEKTPLQAACLQTWNAYSLAYSERYGTGPVRNAKVSTQVKQFVQRLGFDEAPLVAAFYVGHANAFYVKKSHDFGSLLASCEGIRTEWATGRMVTATSAQQTDRTQSNFNSANEAIRILEARGATA